MSYWTSRATVQLHLAVYTSAPSAIVNERISLFGETPYNLSRGSISGIEVKSIETHVPSVQSITLTGTGQTALATGNIVEGSFLVASDDVLSIVYDEGRDYIVNYDSGLVERTADSNIVSGSTVKAVYLFFNVFTVALDYIVDLSGGVINRVSTGAIRPGQLLFIDFSTTETEVQDALIDQAILEAEDSILNRLSSDFSSASTDQGLITGSTWLAISIICRSKAMDILLHYASDEVDGASSVWLKISETYEKSAFWILDKFLESTASRTTQIKKTS